VSVRPIPASGSPLDACELCERRAATIALDLGRVTLDVCRICDRLVRSDPDWLVELAHTGDGLELGATE
jgi:hypothetical protein